MNLTRIETHALPLFKTFGAARVPPWLDILSESRDLSLLDDLPSLGLAVVGSRYPQRRSIELLEKTIYELRGTGLVIISGLARGIDSRAHELALEHGLKTIAFLGCGIDVPYPRENTHLKKKIIQAGGLVISQFEKEVMPYSSNFDHRNLLIAGFAKATWVVEAAIGSGTLNTAKHVCHLNRDLYATPAFPGDHFYLGNQHLLSQLRSDRFPVANPLYQVQSFAQTWAALGAASAKNSQTVLPLFKPKTRIQKWILQLKSEFGECQIQSLMNHAYSQGLTPGKFYLEYENELKMGQIQQNENGTLELRLPA